MKRSKHSLSNYKLCTLNMGALVPIGLTEVLPGDTIQQATSALIRCAPLTSPVMHPVRVRIHHWFVPHRIVWDDWEKFITGGPDGMDASVFPYRTVSGDISSNGIGTLLDYLGVPTVNYTGNPITFSALPLRGYQKIFNEWYRDQDLTTEVTVSTASGSDTTTSGSLQNVSWEKDYFTSSRLVSQKGPDVVLPLGDSAPVNPLTATSTNPTFQEAGGAGLTNTAIRFGAGGNVQYTGSPPGGAPGMAWDDPGLVADLSAATSVSINTVREAFALQRFEEARARYGSRYTEYLRYLGIRSSDARLQRPEYLGGGKQTIQFSEVLQTSVSVDASDDEIGAVGDMYGHGIASMRSNRYRRFFEEHGYVFTLMSVLPKTIYSQGLPRHFSRRTKEDFWQKELEHIGQQEVYNSEIYLPSADPSGRFGFQDRYDDYRRIESSIAGEFKTTLTDWHMARIFSSAPTLNGDFVKANPTNRIFANQTAGPNQLYVMANHSIQARRLVSKMGNSFIY